MAILRAKKIREMGEKERTEKLNELKFQIMKERSKLASTGIPDNPGKLKEIRRTIARIHTINTELESKKVPEVKAKNA